MSGIVGLMLVENLNYRNLFLSTTMLIDIMFQHDGSKVIPGTNWIATCRNSQVPLLMDMKHKNMMS